MNGVIIAFAIIGIMSTALFLVAVVMAWVVTIQNENRYRRITKEEAEQMAEELRDAIRKGDDGGVY